MPPARVQQTGAGSGGGIAAGDDVTWTGAHIFQNTLHVTSANSFANAMQVGDGTNAARIAAVGGIATIYGGAGTSKYLRIGDASVATKITAPTEDDIVFTGMAEFRGSTVYLANTYTQIFSSLTEFFGATVQIKQDNDLNLGSNKSTTAIFRFDGSNNPDTLRICPGEDSNYIEITSNDNISQTYNLAQQTNPTLVLRSAEAAAASTTSYISFAHDQTDGVITTGKGAIKGVSGVADGASAIAFINDTTNTLATSGAKHTVWRNATTDLMTLDKDGQLTIASDLIAATGNEVALSLDYTVNKATSGHDTGLVINQTDTLSPGTSLLLDAQVGGASKCTISQSGQVNATADGLATLVKAGTLSDADFTDDTDGLLGIDSSNGRIYFRYGAAWHYVNQTAGFEINAKNTDCVICCKPMQRGHAVIGILDSEKSDGAMHGEYAHAKCALKEEMKFAA